MDANLGGAGDAARVMRGSINDSIFCFWRLRAFANHVDILFFEKPVSRDN